MAIFSSDLAHSTRRRWTLYAGTLVFLGLFGSWLALDFLHERARTLDEMGRLALHKSQLLSSVFGDAFLSADYVLRDIAGRIDVDEDFGERKAAIDQPLQFIHDMRSSPMNNNRDRLWILAFRYQNHIFPGYFLLNNQAG